MSHHESLSTPVRFKFMPTPNSKLHVGHAWLIFVMHTLLEAVRREGREAELVLVLDEIGLTPSGSFDGEVTKRCGHEILRAMEQLDMEPDLVIWNGDGQYVQWANDPTIHKPELETWDPNWTRPSTYFLYNALLDVHLGITHVIRGEDRREFHDLYEECYQKLGWRTSGM